MSWELSAFDDGENEHHWLVERIASGFRVTTSVCVDGEPESDANTIDLATVDDVERYLAGECDQPLSEAAARLVEMIRHG